MSYIRIVGENLEAMLAQRNVAESDRQEIITYVKHIVLESYQNGRAAVRETRPPRRSKRAT